MPSLSLRPSSASDAAALYSSSHQDIADRVSAMLHQESSATYLPIDYLSADTTIGDMERQDLLLSRSKMCEWCHSLVDTCQLSREAVTRSMGYFDRFLASNAKRARRALLDKREYQLASMTCLYVSVKVHEALAMDAALLSEISAGCYSVDEILDMEQCLLRTLGWRLSGPTAKEFACNLLGLLGPDAYGYDLDALRELLDGTSHRCEVAAGDHALSTACLPSEIAVAAILDGLDAMDEDAVPLKARYRYLLRLGDVLPDTDMRRVGRIQAKLRKVYLKSMPQEFKRQASHRSVISECSMAERWSSESEEDVPLCREVSCSSPTRMVSTGARCITPM